jgi:hypothetical protein
MIGFGWLIRCSCDVGIFLISILHIHIQYLMFMGEDEHTNLHTILDVVGIGRGPHTRCG